MPINPNSYSRRGNNNLGAVVRCPNLVADRLVYFDHDSVTGAWVIRDFISGLKLDNHKSSLTVAQIEADADYDEYPPPTVSRTAVSQLLNSFAKYVPETTMKKMPYLLIYLITLVVAEGCNTSNSAHDTFKSFAERVQTELPKVLSDRKVVEPVSFDVQKTDSLVSPYTAHLTFSTSLLLKDVAKGEPKYNYSCNVTENCRADYAQQEGVWVCKQITGTCKDMTFVSGNREFFQDMKKATIGKTIVKINGADIASRPSSDKFVELLRSCNR